MCPRPRPSRSRNIVSTRAGVQGAKNGMKPRWTSTTRCWVKDGIGVRLASLIATLRTVMRLPIRQIQTYLLTLHGVRISSGEMVELLHRIKAQLQPHLAALKREIRASPAVQADETGWREDGINGYIWSVSTPDIRYFEYHHSRGGDVIKELIGKI